MVTIRFRTAFPGMLLAALALGCAGTDIPLRKSPPDTRVHLDGRLLPPSATRIRPAYYGTLRLDADHGPEGRRGFRPQTARLDRPVPAPRWIFPLDLFGEALTRLFGSGPEAVDLRLESFEAPDPTDEAGRRALLDRALEAFRRR